MNYTRDYCINSIDFTTTQHTDTKLIRFSVELKIKFKKNMNTRRINRQSKETTELRVIIEHLWLE